MSDFDFFFLCFGYRNIDDVFYSVHAQWSKYPAAESLYKQALDIYQNAYGADHIMVAKVIVLFMLLTSLHSLFCITFVLCWGIELYMVG